MNIETFFFILDMLILLLSNVYVFHWNSQSTKNGSMASCHLVMLKSVGGTEDLTRLANITEKKI